MEHDLFEQIRRRAEEDPASPALVLPGGAVVSRGALASKAARISERMTRIGLRPDAVAAFVEPDPVELLSLFLGIAPVCACAPLNPALSVSDLEFHMPDLRPVALVAHDVNSAAAAQGRTLDLLILKTSALTAAEPDGSPGWVCPRPAPSQMALLLHTSATTGRPKLVPLTHRHLHAMAGNAVRLLELTAGDRFLSMMPLFHLQGLISALAQLACGGSVVPVRGFDATQFAGWLSDLQPTWYTAGPALHSAILPVARREAGRIRQAPLRFARSIGARLSPGLHAELESALGVPVLEGYGLTETGTVTSNPLPPGIRKPGSAGPASGAQLAIFGEDGQTLGTGTQGQIAVRGPAVFGGYLHHEEATRAAFRDDWFLTGDLGWLDDDGYLFISGRLKEMINRGGEKVLPGEIDDVLMAHPSVARAAAFAMPHPTLGEDVAATVVLRPGASVLEAELRRYVAAQLTAYKIPRRILFLESLPVGATGKPRRAELSRLIAGSRPAYQPPASGTQQRLARIWQNLLHVEQAGISDDFFGLGGDSFALTLLMTELEAEFGDAASRVDESEFFANPDIETLARLLDGGSNCPAPSVPAERPPYIALQREGRLTPFFCIPGADENPYYFRELAQCLGDERPFYVLRDPQPLQERGSYTVEQAAARYAGFLRQIQPHGPYLLGGHCFGGMLAFETARQLTAQGAEVNRVVMFEVPTPGYPKPLKQWRRYSALAADLLLGRRRLSRVDVSTHLRLLIGLAQKRTNRIRQTALPFDAPSAPVHPNLRAAGIYSPKPFSGRVTHFMTPDEPRRGEVLESPLLGWRDFVRGEFEVRYTPGPAADIFRYPHVREMAARLHAVLASEPTSNPL